MYAGTPDWPLHNQPHLPVPGIPVEHILGDSGVVFVEGWGGKEILAGPCLKKANP